MGPNSESASLGAEKHALYCDDVTQVVCLEAGIGFWSDIILGNEVLHFAREVSHRGKARFTHHALEHHTTRTSHLNLLGFELSLIHVAIFFNKVAKEVRAFEVVGIGNPFSAQLR